MTRIQYVKKNIGTSYFVWFKESNLFYQLKKPAWYVFEKLIKNMKSETIANEFSEHYNISSEESLNFVNDMHAKISELNRLHNTIGDKKQRLPNLDNYQYKPYTTHNYLIGNQHIQFSFETNWLEYYIHPLIEHLEVENSKLDQTHFELFTYNNRVIFRFNNKTIGNWADDESHLVKGKIFMNLINTIYKKTDSAWLMTVHASALTNEKKTLLFSAPPNSGKTTIAALLHNQGYRIISDDFVAIDHSFKAYPFPSAISVKEKSLDLLRPFFPTLTHKKLFYINDEKSVRYLPMKFAPTKIFPVGAFVFIEYNKNVEFEWEKLDCVKGIKLLLEQAWVSPTSENVEILFDKLEESSFFQLTYSNNKKAIKVIKNLFEYD